MSQTPILSILLLAAYLSLSSADKSTSTPVPWFWRTASPRVLQNHINGGYRIVVLQLVSTSPYILTALFVRNTGIYSKTWYWFWNIDASTLADNITSLTARIVDLEPYTVGDQTLFAVVLHKSTGSNAKDWWYYYDTSPPTIAQKLRDNEARLIDLDTYFVDGSTKYSAVMIRNTGEDARKWWWYCNVSPSFISQRLRTNRARLTGIERNGPERYTVIMKRHRTSLRWYYYFAQPSSELLQKAAQNGARIVDVEPFTQNGVHKFVGIMISNVNDLTRRVADYISQHRRGGAYGLYMRKIGGPTYAALQQNYVYEPASSIKALHLAHAMRQVQLGTDSLNNPILIFTDMFGSCPQNSGSESEALETALMKMMRQSSNSHTEAIRARYGQHAINFSAQQLGMTSSRICHRIGCAFSKPGITGQINEPNSLTLVDITRLYEHVATSFLKGSHRKKFLHIMSGYGSLTRIINEETSKLQLVSNKTRDQFKTLVLARQKGGSYTINGRYYRSIAAYVKLPFGPCTGFISFREYVLGAFIDQSTSSVSSGVIGTAGAETMREEVRKALISFQPCFRLVPGFSSAR